MKMKDSDQIVDMRSDGDLFIAADRPYPEKPIEHAGDDDFIVPEPRPRPEAVYTPDSLTNSLTGLTPSWDTSVDRVARDDGFVFFKLPKNGDTSRELSHSEAMEEEYVSAPRKVIKGSNRNPNMANPIIVVVGATGAGKSSFIDLLGGINDTGGRPEINDGLAPCTKKITRYNVTINEQPIQLLDTPGFDDTTLTDSENLEALSLQLAQIHKERRPLNGIIYLYDISNHRISGQSTNNLITFQQLVGDDSLKNVILVTTNWGKSEEIQMKREEQMKTIYWKTMSLYGSRIERHDGSRESATQIVQSLLIKPPTVIKIVDELVLQGLRWDETAIGKSMSEALEALQTRMQEELTKLKTQLERLEEMRIAEAEQAQLREAELDSRYIKEAQSYNRHAVDAIADLKRQLKIEQDDQNAVQQAKEEAAKEDIRILRERLDRATSQQDRLKHGIDEAADNPSEEQSKDILPKKTLYFQHLGYQILDLIAWLCWIIMTMSDILVWVKVSVEADKDISLIKPTNLIVWTMFTVMLGGGHILFNRTFFNSRGPEENGIFLLFINFSFRALIYNINPSSAGKLPVYDVSMMCCVFFIGLRYVYGSS